MRLHLVRHATLLIDYAGRRLLVDPVLGPPEGQPPVDDTPNPRRNPLVALPEPATRYVEGVDAALITHTHSDHLDPTGIELLPWGLALHVQPEDAETIAGHGFTTVVPVQDEVDFAGVAITRTAARHGHGEIAEAMAPSSGYVLRAPGEPTLYVAGDSVWCEEVAAAIERHAPDAIVVNAGAAQFHAGGPITMTAADVIETARAAPSAQVFPVHMEAINHCLLGRDELAEAIGAAGMDFGERVRILVDGERTEVSSADHR